VLSATTFVSTTNWSNFGLLSRRAGLSATTGLSCCFCFRVLD